MENFLDVYQRLQADNLDLLKEIYEEGVIFVDPAHKIEGITQLTDYFRNLYSNINHISFEFHHPLQVNDVGYVQWTMTFSHPGVKKGDKISVEGATFLQFGKDGRVIFHRDHFDLGSMLYQHIPILGGVIKTIKRRLGK